MNTFYLKHISLAIIHTTILKIKYNSMLFITTTTLLTLPLCCLRFRLVILSVHACYIMIASVEMVWQCKTSLWTSCSGGSDALLLVNMDCNCMTIPSSKTICTVSLPHIRKNISLYKLIHMTFS